MFKYGEKEVLKDLTDFAKVGYGADFVPSFYKKVKEFLTPEMKNFKKYYEDKNHLLQFYFVDDYFDYREEDIKEKRKTIYCSKEFQSKKWRKDFEKYYKNFLKFLPNKERRDRFIDPKVDYIINSGRRGALAFTSLDYILGRNELNHCTYIFMLNNFNSPYTMMHTFFHEMCHIVQINKYYPNIYNEYRKKVCEIRENDSTRIRINEFRKIDIEYDDFFRKSDYEKEVCADIFGPFCALLIAYKSQDVEFIRFIKHFINRVSLYKGLKKVTGNSDGLDYFARPILKYIIPTLSEKNYVKFFDKSGYIDYDSVYDYCFKFFKKYCYKYDDYKDFVDKERKLIDDEKKKLKDLKKGKSDEEAEKLEIRAFMNLQKKYPKNKIMKDLMDAYNEYKNSKLTKEEQFFEVFRDKLYNVPLNVSLRDCNVVRNELFEIRKISNNYLDRKQKYNRTKFVKKMKKQYPSPFMKKYKKLESRVKSLFSKKKSVKKK